MSKKKPATKEERDHMGRVASLGCLFHPGTPPVVHHIRFEVGMAQREDHFGTIPLCHECHVGSFSIHNDKQNFMAVYKMTELDMLMLTYRQISRNYIP